MEDAVVDACCLINFVAADCLPEVVTASGLRWHVPRQVLGEVVFVPEQSEKPKTARDLLVRFSANGVLHECAVEEIERNLFIRFAVELDDGEAAALAIAVSRGWRLATDDRKAIRLASTSGVRVVTTPELVHRWAERGRPTPANVRSALDRIQRLARFAPRRDDPLFDWWTQHLGG